MVLSLRITLAVGILLFTLILFHYLRKQKLYLKYTLLWLFADLIMIVLMIFPEIVSAAAKLAGVVDVTNMVFMFVGAMALLILLGMTVIVTTLSNRIYRLTQQQAILEKRVRELENRKQPEAQPLSGQPAESDERDS